MEDNGAQRYGAAKVIPPKEWCPCRNYDAVKDFNISTPISQFVTGQQGVYQLFNIQKKGLSFTQFKEMANSDRYKPPEVKDNEELERKYWKNITFNQPLYGADIPGSLYDKDVTEWNINRLGTILDTVSEEYGVSIPGVNTAYMYFGMWKTSFAWHTEDMDLYSINYLHFGASKQWYVIPPAHAERLERLAKTLFPEYFEQCPSFLRHKMSVISPSVLKQHSIPFGKIVQQEGQFVVTFPCGYHAGFNQGLNCAESTNFASVRWINYGKKATRCVCNNDMVKIDMDVFVRKFQPELWETYCREKELKLLSSKRKEHPRKSLVTGTKHTRLIEIPSEASPTKKSKVKEEFEEEEEDEDIDEETELDWTMRFNRLWQFQRCDFKVEQAFNQLMSCGGTQCCVCILFVSPSPFQLYDARRLKSSVKCLMARETSARKKFGNDGLKVAVQRSSIQLPASLSHLNNLTDEEEEGSQLLTCSMCGITVHHSCYGVSDLPINPRKWLCRRCEVKAWHAECCLCVLRGGALKPTDNPSGQWAHVVCAVTIPDIVFGCTELKEPVVLSSLTRSRQRIKCAFCVSSPISDNKGKGGVCVQCVWPKCGSTFHVTCAHYQGLVPQQLGGKSGYVCGKHSMEGSIQPIIINAGDEVYAKTNSSRVRYDHGHVTSVDELRSFEVQFDDGTMCSDMARSDLICSEDPILGSEIRVRWSKREIYSARVIGFTTVPQYVVEFDDGAENVLTEEYIYSIHEPLPRKIRDSLKRRSNGRLKSSPPATKSRPHVIDS